LSSTFVPHLCPLKTINEKGIMKHRTKPNGLAAPERPREGGSEQCIRLHTHPVHYRWSTPEGVHHASTVVLSRTKGGLRNALRRFWQTNPHVEAA
jgi:hypothetical protein